MTVRTQAMASGLACLAWLATAPAWAAPNDIHLLGLTDPGGQPDNVAFRDLTTELGFVMTPTHINPAETTGQAGFDFAIDTSLHVISFWEEQWDRGRKGTGLDNQPPVVPTMETLAVRGRKGFVLPVPLTSEVEMGAMWILESGLVAISAKGKVALNEGILWLPDIALDAGITRLVGSDDLDLTTATVGGAVSKGFAIFGDFEVVPFFAYESIFIDARTRLVDADPTNTSDVGNTFTFQPVAMAQVVAPSQEACTSDVLNCVALNRYDRVSAGVRVQVAIVQIGAGLDLNIFPDRLLQLSSGSLDRSPVMAQGTIRFGLLF